jgi:hypothetical protein
MLALLAAVAQPGDARATGGFGCEAKDNVLAFAADSAFSHGLGGQFLNFTAEAELFLPELPAELRKRDLKDALVHHWFYDRHLKLHFYVETEGDAPFASAELAIEAAGDAEDEDLDYEGTYTLDVFVGAAKEGEEPAVIKKTGMVTCSVG